MIMPNLIVSEAGGAKTGKTHLAFTFPEPIVVFSFDIGQEPVLAKFPDKDIKVIPYIIPLYETVRAVGMKKDISNLWAEFSADFKDAADKPTVKTLIVDTATALYEICRIGRSGELGRELAPIEYGDVYLRMKALIHRARITGQNLVLTHYLKDIYVGDKPTGEKALDGWRHTEGEVDVVLTTRREVKVVGQKKENVIITTIKDNRYDLALNGLESINMTYDDLITLLGVGG